MLQFEFKNYIVNSEIDIADGKVQANLTVCFVPTGDEKNIVPTITADLIVINLNSQTGIEMDEQRKEESITFVEKLNKTTTT